MEDRLPSHRAWRRRPYLPVYLDFGDAAPSSVITTPAPRSRSANASPSPVAGVSTPPRDGPPGSVWGSSAMHSADSQTNVTVARFDGSPLNEI
jgi:hypothetical protein